MRRYTELTRVEQPSQQQSIYNKIGKLTVRLLVPPRVPVLTKYSPVTQVFL